MHSEKNPDGTSYSNFPRPAPSLTADDMLKEIAPPKFISAKLSSWSWSSHNQNAGKKVLSVYAPEAIVTVALLPAATSEYETLLFELSLN